MRRGNFWIVKGDGKRGRLALSDFEREAGTAECPDGKGESCLGEARVNDLRHAQKSVVLDTFGGADDYLACVQVRTDALKGRTEKLRWNNRYNDLGIADGGVVAGNGDLQRQRKAGEKELVFACVDDLLGKLRTVRPKCEFMAAATMQ